MKRRRGNVSRTIAAPSGPVDRAAARNREMNAFVIDHHPKASQPFDGGRFVDALLLRAAQELGCHRDDQPYVGSHPFGHSSRPAPSHRLRLRPPGPARTPDHPVATGSPLPQQDLQLFAAGDARDPFRQLAAGSARQLAGALRLPREVAGIPHRGRPSDRDGGLQPLRLLPRGICRDLPLRLQARAGGGAEALSGAREDRRALRGLSRRRPSRRGPHRRLSGLAQSEALAGHPLRHPHGARRPGARRDAGTRLRLVP